jgi:hypothetical protein
MTADSIADIVELHEAGNFRDANRYLAAGYILIKLSDRGQASKKPESKEYYVRRWPCFILGRTADVAHFELEPSTTAVPA